MPNKITDLAIIDTQKVQLVPSADVFASIKEDLADIDYVPFGRIEIAAAGAGVFKVTDAGEDDAVVATEITGVIMMSHKTNALWLSKYGTTDDKLPDCSSINGETGVVRTTGECKDCATCPYNQFGSADDGKGRGKACKNGRRLYIMRDGDIFPMLLPLPPSALTVYDKYRTKVMLARKKIYGVLTKIKLASAKNADGIAYSTPVFEAVATLPPDESERVRQYAEQFSAAAERVGVTAEDSGGSVPTSQSVPAPDPVPAQNAEQPIQAEGGFVQIDDNPFE